MISCFSLLYASRRHSPCGSEDWNLGISLRACGSRCHSPCGSVDWNIIFPSFIVAGPRSLPLRECGLKCWDQGQGYPPCPSLPLRECGLKSAWAARRSLVPASLPLRECGLKLTNYRSSIEDMDVTPLAGVWIEIQLSVESGKIHIVTPLAGVWIEISMNRTKNKVYYRHSPCGSVDWNLSISW